MALTSPSGQTADQPSNPNPRSRRDILLNIEEQAGHSVMVFRGPGWTWTLRPDQRWINAVTKAREYKHKVWSQGARRWLLCSHSKRGATHQIFMTAADGPRCDCYGFQHTGCCFHLGALYLRIVREACALRLSDLEPTPYELFEGEETTRPVRFLPLVADEWGEIVEPQHQTAAATAEKPASELTELERLFAA
jgi:hypothetical protein